MKTFTSPADYGTKVIAKIREFNTSLLIVKITDFLVLMFIILSQLNDDQLQLLEGTTSRLLSQVIDAFCFQPFQLASALVVWMLLTFSSPYCLHGRKKMSSQVSLYLFILHCHVVFPVLDLVRLAMLNKQCCDYLTTSDIGRDLFQLLIKLAR